ncbi:hypothetical protein BJ878DRAFT_71058 [Calycina marina]|uniref:Secreted protein n=1 Tax=Calycina marina TaxID=1763456 RepID=A0A9P8CIC5_9HELO|nr:hypothetical protein BJ878DRAFT_71058 [Calycina marina]
MFILLAFLSRYSSCGCGARHQPSSSFYVRLKMTPWPRLCRVESVYRGVEGGGVLTSPHFLLFTTYMLHFARDAQSPEHAGMCDTSCQHCPLSLNFADRTGYVWRVTHHAEVA